MPDRLIQEIVTDRGVKVYVWAWEKLQKTAQSGCQAKIHALTSQFNEDDREVSPDSCRVIVSFLWGSSRKFKPKSGSTNVKPNYRSRRNAHATPQCAWVARSKLQKRVKEQCE